MGYHVRIVYLQGPVSILDLATSAATPPIATTGTSAYRAALMPMWTAGLLAIPVLVFRLLAMLLPILMMGLPIMQIQRVDPMTQPVVEPEPPDRS